MMTRVTFLMIAGIAVAAALGLVLRRNAIHGALFLVMNLGCVAAFYLMLGAEFLAAAQVIVYAGAIMVLFVFAIMVLIPGKEETGPDVRKAWRLLAAPLGGALLLELVLLVTSRAAAPAPTGTTPVGSAAAIGRLLFTDYLLPFELTSVLLLAAMVGVLLLARSRDGRATPPGSGPEATVHPSAEPQRAEREVSVR
jgi:NADH-quinone oxidoreductase subunit J